MEVRPQDRGAEAEKGVDLTGRPQTELGPFQKCLALLTGAAPLAVRCLSVMSSSLLCCHGSFSRIQHLGAEIHLIRDMMDPIHTGGLHDFLLTALEVRDQGQEPQTPW